MSDYPEREIASLERQRDYARSELTTAHGKLAELWQKVVALERELTEADHLLGRGEHDAHTLGYRVQRLIGERDELQQQLAACHAHTCEGARAVQAAAVARYAELEWHARNLRHALMLAEKYGSFDPLSDQTIIWAIRTTLAANPPSRMDPVKRKRLEEAGWKFGTAEEFLGITDDEPQAEE